MSDRISVVVADDHPLYRGGILRAVKQRPELELVGEAADGREALEEIRRRSPALAVLDVRMPAMSGPRVLEALNHDRSETRVVLLSAQVDTETVHSVVAQGAAGYLSKDSGARETCEAIEQVARGETVLASEVHSALRPE